MLSVDISKAFDRLPHATVLECVETYDFHPTITRWIISFLSSRRQRVRIWSNESSWMQIPSGVPQGSVVGPVLFSMAMDSLKPVSENSQMIKYADDVSLLHFVRKVGDDDLQCEWNNITDWANAVGLSLNLSKSCVMDFVTKRDLCLQPISDSAGNIVPNKDEINLLGISFSSDMRWNTHVDKVVRKSSKRLYIIRNLRRSSYPPHIIFKVYVAFVRSVLLHGFPVFCNAPNYLKNRLSSVENRALKIIGNGYQPSLMTKSNEICFRLLSKVSSNSDHPLRILFEERIPTRRNPSSLRAPLARTKRYQSSFVIYCDRSKF